MVDDTARALGIGTRAGMASPFIRAIARTGQFKLSRAAGPDGLSVRRKLPSLSLQQVARLPVHLRDAHDAWQQDERREPSAEERRTRARRLALSLLELGETTEATEQQLHRWRIHPALAHEALRWAEQRRGGGVGGQPIPAPPAPVQEPARVLTRASADGTAAPTGPTGRPRIGATRPAPPARIGPFDPFDPPLDAA